MEFPVPAYTTFVIPTGATTGHRIVLDGTTGKILVYNDSNILVDEIGGTFGEIISHATGLTNDVGFTEGSISFGSAPDFTGAATIYGNLIFGGGLFFSSGVETGNANKADAVEVVYFAGKDNVKSGDTNVPQIIIGDANLDSPVDVLLTGALVKASVSAQAAETWHTPSYKANWSAGNLLNGLGGPGVQYRLMPDDTVWIYGLCKPAAGAGTTIFTLPSGYYPLTSGSANMGIHNGLTCNYAIDTTTGNFIVNTVVVGDTYLIDVRIPLRNIG